MQQGGAHTSALLPNMNYSFDKKPSDGFWEPVRHPRRLTTPGRPNRVNIRRGWQRCDTSDGRHNRDARLGSNLLNVLQLWLRLPASQPSEKKGIIYSFGISGAFSTVFGTARWTARAQVMGGPFSLFNPCTCRIQSAATIASGNYVAPRASLNFHHFTLSHL